MKVAKSIADESDDELEDRNSEPKPDYEREDSNKATDNEVFKKPIPKPLTDKVSFNAIQTERLHVRASPESLRCGP